VKNTEIPLLLKWDKKAYGSLDKNECGSQEDGIEKWFKVN
tara:strand:+ start:307 stop:426 length:120 start_codon:yes stop_codon:yes gene_type:complete